MGQEIYKVIDVSVIIVNYNSFELLDNCLHSIFVFTNEITIEVIVVDNNSEQGNVSKIINKYPGVILIKNSSNLGFAAANNQGIKLANGNYILFLNNDTLFLENTIKKVFDWTLSQQYDIVLGCKLLNKDGSLQISFSDFLNVSNSITSNLFLYLLFPKSKYFNKYHLSKSKITKPIEVDYVVGAFLYCSKKVAVDLKGFDDRFFFYAEEMDFCYRFKKQGGRVYYFPDSAIIHIGGATAEKSSWFVYKNKWISTIQFYQKHYTGYKFFSSLLANYVGALIRIPIFVILGVIRGNKNLIYRGFYNCRVIFYYPSNKFY
jgi:GT2 family glycosyltransferase